MTFRRSLQVFLALVVAVVALGLAQPAGAVDNPDYTAPPPASVVESSTPEPVRQVQTAAVPVQRLAITGSDSAQLAVLGAMSVGAGGAVVAGGPPSAVHRLTWGAGPPTCSARPDQRQFRRRAASSGSTTARNASMVAVDRPAVGRDPQRVGIGQGRPRAAACSVGLVGGQPDQVLGGHPGGEAHLVVVDVLAQVAPARHRHGLTTHRPGVHDPAGTPLGDHDVGLGHGRHQVLVA